METFYTVLAGTLVYVLGQSVQRFIIEPIEEQRRIIGEIDNDRIFLANLAAHVPYREPPDGQKLVQPDDPIEASRRVRRYAARLRSTLWTIPLYDLWAKLHIVKKRKVIEDASKKLILWSNSIFGGKPGEARDELALLLGLPIEDADPAPKTQLTVR